jgi:hypothetical protein
MIAVDANKEHVGKGADELRSKGQVAGVMGGRGDGWQG